MFDKSVPTNESNEDDSENNIIHIICLKNIASQFLSFFKKNILKNLI